MSYLDEIDGVESWTYEQIVIEYISNIRTKKIRKYYPDFFIKYSDGHCEVVEIKPKRRLDQFNVKKKIAAAKSWCGDKGYEFKIITEVELKQLNLL